MVIKPDVIGPLIELTINMNQAAYLNRLGYQLLPLIEHLIDTALFQDDDSRVHSTAWICDWYDEHTFTLSHLDWFAKSPPLNPIENLWGNFDERLKPQNQHNNVCEIWWLYVIC